ncbi:MAG: single-stranded DNA-binding protein, partial [Planctomycetaceae bacterium]
GQKRSKLKVVCENMKMVGGRQDGGGGSPGDSRQQRPAAAPAANRSAPETGHDEPPQHDPTADFYDSPSGGDVPEDEVPF